MIAIYSVDITIDEEGCPQLIEINGSNSGFDGFLIAYQDTRIQDAIRSAFREFVGNSRIFVVTRLVNFGELPKGYLDKVVRDSLYFKSIKNVHRNLRDGIVGITWARLRTDRPPSTLGAGTSLDALVARDDQFKKVLLNVADTSYVIPAEYFKNDTDLGALSFKETTKGTIQALGLQDQDALWFRCPSLGFAQPVAKGIHINEEFPYDALADNKSFTYELLSDTFPQNVPLSIPIGNRCSGSATVHEMLSQSNNSLFIRKPLLGSQARGIEILRRDDIEDYAKRLAHLEESERIDSSNKDQKEIPLELKGATSLIAARALSLDISLLSELKQSKPVYCRSTRRYHYGCMRTLALLKAESSGLVEIRFLGAYWRLARVPVDGDGLLWERYVGSQSQGAFCESVAAPDMVIAEEFTKQILLEFCNKLSTMPRNRHNFEEWEKNYWLSRYRTQVPYLEDERHWRIFQKGISKTNEESIKLKAEAEGAGFRRVPTAFLTKEQVIMARLPYLIKEPHRIIIPF